jgi:hypothetical protein
LKLAIALFSIALNVWVIRFWFKQQLPLDAATSRLRWTAVAVCAVLIAVLALVSRSMGRRWVDEHLVLGVLVAVGPVSLFYFFIFFPGLSRWLAKRLADRS